MTTGSGLQGTTRTIKASGVQGQVVSSSWMRWPRAERRSSSPSMVRPVSRLMPYREKPRSVFGRGKGMIEIHGDIVEPMPAEWFEDADDSAEDLF